MNKLTSLSLFFPAYNEAENIFNTITSALAVAPEVAKEFEIIVVNDASTDATVQVVKSIAQRNAKVRLVSHLENWGYGKAVKTGLQAAQCDYVFFTDSDCQFDLTELRKLVAYADEYDVVIGYRAKRMDPPLRLINAKGWSILNRLFFDLHVKDIDCAFKLLRRDVVQPLELVSDGAMVSAELLIRLQQQGIGYKEVPVTHLPRLKGTATGAKPAVIAKAFGEMLRLFFDSLGQPTRHQLSLFALVGLINTGIDLAVFLFLTDVVGLFSGNEIIAKALSFSVGVLSSFLLNSSFTFQARHYQSRGFVSFASASVVGLLINTTAFAAARAVSVDPTLSVLFAVACSFVVSYALMKTWVFEPQTR